MDKDTLYFNIKNTYLQRLWLLKNKGDPKGPPLFQLLNLAIHQFFFHSGFCSNLGFNVICPLGIGYR